MNKLLLVPAFFVASISTLSAQSLPGARINLNPERLRFAYWGNDGLSNLVCTHKINNEMTQDWDVECNDALKQKKTYSVHLWATLYRRQKTPEQTIEILYWVSDRSEVSSTKHTGTSFWLNTTTAAPFHSLTISQAVDNDTASLYLDIKPE